MTLIWCAYFEKTAAGVLRALWILGVLYLRFGARELIVVKNSEKAYTPQMFFMRTRVLTGSNTANEFGAWIEGLHSKEATVIPDESVICANDTLLHHGRLRFGDLIDLVSHSKEKATNALLSGFVSEIQWEGCALDGYEMKSNVCSKLFFVRASLLNNDLLKSGMEEAARYAAGASPIRMSAQYFAFFDKWLHGDGGPRWYKARPVACMSAQEKRMKSAMIICEHMLTRAANGDVQPIARTWLRDSLGKIKRALF